MKFNSDAYFDIHKIWQATIPVYQPFVLKEIGGLRPERAIDAMRKYMAKHSPMSAELRGTFVAV
jgi:hypothetical protein